MELPSIKDRSRPIFLLLCAVLGLAGVLCFKMYTNYNDQGSRFGGEDGGSSIQALSDDPDWITSYAATTTSGSQLCLMLINKDPEKLANAEIVLNGFQYQSEVGLYRYGNDHLQGITQENVSAQLGNLRLTLPVYSMTLLILSRSG